VTRATAEGRLPFFIEEIHNLKRLLSSIGYVPIEFEESVLKLKPADWPVLNL